MNIEQNIRWFRNNILRTLSLSWNLIAIVKFLFRCGFLEVIIERRLDSNLYRSTSKAIIIWEHLNFEKY